MRNYFNLFHTVYDDYITIVSKNLKLYGQYIWEELLKHQEDGIKITRKKSKFHVEEIFVLSFVAGFNGMGVDFKKINAIMK